MCFDVPFYWCLLADLIKLAIFVGIPIGVVLLIRYLCQSEISDEDVVEPTTPRESEQK